MHMSFMHAFAQDCIVNFVSIFSTTFTSFLWVVHWSQRTQAKHHTLMNGKLPLHLYSSTGIRVRDTTRVSSAVCSIDHHRYQWCQNSWASSVSIEGYAILMYLIESYKNCRYKIGIECAPTYSITIPANIRFSWDPSGTVTKRSTLVQPQYALVHPVPDWIGEWQSLQYLCSVTFTSGNNCRKKRFSKWTDFGSWLFSGSMYPQKQQHLSKGLGWEMML